jgi:thiamine kinase-like enzyme
MTSREALEPATLRALRATACRLMPDWSISELDEFHYLPGGYSNDNYRFRYRSRHYVLRVPLNPKAEIDWRREHDFYRQPGGILRPGLVAMDTHDGTMISRWVTGELLSDARPDNARLVTYTQNLHVNLAATATPPERRYDPIQLARDYLAIAPRQVPAMVAAQLHGLEFNPAASTLCHNDLNPWNVIAPAAEVGTWVTLDWECPGLNDPVFDLVTLHQGLGRNMEELTALTEQLLQTQPDAERIASNLRAFWLREFCWAFAAWHQGNEREEIAEQMRNAEGQLAALMS